VPRRKDDAGKFATEYPPAVILDAVESHTPATTGEIVEAVGCSANLARGRLHELAENGAIRKKETPGGYIWIAD